MPLISPFVQNKYVELTMELVMVFMVYGGHELFM